MEIDSIQIIFDLCTCTWLMLKFYLGWDLNANGASAGKKGNIMHPVICFFVHVLFVGSYYIYMCTHAI